MYIQNHILNKNSPEQLSRDISPNIGFNGLTKSVQNLILEEDVKNEFICSFRDLILYLFKSKILSSLSHELKTPLNCSIAMLQDALEDCSIPKQCKKLNLEPALFSQYQLLSTVSDIIDYSLILENQFSLHKKKFLLNEELDIYKRIIQYQASRKNLKFSIFIEDDVPNELYSDPKRLFQVLLNLLGNSIKFTKQGFIKLNISKSSIHSNKLVFFVEDSGIGIKEKELTCILEQKNKLNSAAIYKKNSKKLAGLGLLVSNSIAKSLGEDDGLQVYSKYGMGSRFYFNVIYTVDQIKSIVLYQSVSNEEEKANDDNDISSKKKSSPNHSMYSLFDFDESIPDEGREFQKTGFLIDAKYLQGSITNKTQQNSNTFIKLHEINDNDSQVCNKHSDLQQQNRSSLESFYSNKEETNDDKHQIANKKSFRVSNDNNQIIEVRNKLARRNNFNMLKYTKNSFNKYQKLSPVTQLQNHIKTINKRLSSFAEEELHQSIGKQSKTGQNRYVEGGYKGSQIRNTDFPIKAFQKQKLQLKANSQFYEEEEIIQKLSIIQKNTKKRILVVDDNDFNQATIIVLIKSLGLEVDAVYDGRQSVDAILKNMSIDNDNPLAKEYSFILMDCDMPIMNGFEATKIIKRYISKGLIKPVIITACTAFNQDKDVKACYDSGMDDIINKPVSKTALQQLFKKWNILS